VGSPNNGPNSRGFWEDGEADTGEQEYDENNSRFYSKLLSEFIHNDEKVMQILPMAFPSYNDQVNALNHALPEWFASETSRESPITLVDCNTGVSNADLLDGVHPNEKGSHKMATAILPKLIDVIENSRGV